MTHDMSGRAIGSEGGRQGTCSGSGERRRCPRALDEHAGAVPRRSDTRLPTRRVRRPAPRRLTTAVLLGALLGTCSTPPATPPVAADAGSPTPSAPRAGTPAPPDAPPDAPADASADASADAPATPAPPKTILLAFDGMDHALTAELLARGELPNLVRLSERGGFGPLDTSNPVQSPASWAVFNTGTNPGRTGVPGFVSRYFMRDPDTGRARGRPLPQPMLGFATTIDHPWHGEVLAAPYEINPMQGVPWWRHLDAAGLRFMGMQVAMTFPPDDEGPHTSLLPGLGLKDVAGSPGSWFVLTDDPWAWDDHTNAGGQIRKVYFDREGQTAARVSLPGPQDWFTRQRLEQRVTDLEQRIAAGGRSTEGEPLDAQLDEARGAVSEFRKQRQLEWTATLRLAPDRSRLTVELGDQRVKLAPGDWSDLLPVSFELADDLVVHGLARFHLMRCDEDEVRLYVPPVQFDPSRPPAWLPLSAPRDFAARVADGIGGPFDTLGWACPTNALKDHAVTQFSAQSFLDQVGLVLDQRERMLHWGLSQHADWDVYMQVFSSTDRVAHMLFRERDPGHPGYDAAYAATEVSAFGRRFPLSRAIDAIYQEADRIVGDVLTRVDAGEFGDDCLLLVLSDHGFSSFRRQVNLNTLLLEHGYLATTGDTPVDELRAPQRDLLLYADWERTRAYSLGLGKVFLNLRGREPLGIVDPSEAGALLAAIRDDLLATTDGEGGPPVVTSVETRDALFHGPWVRETDAAVRRVAGQQAPPVPWDGFADLFVGFAPGYRVAWANTIGGIEPEALTDNDNHWSGAHVSLDPGHVPGVLASNAAIASTAAPRLIDLGAMILARYGLDPAALELEGRPLPFDPPRR